MRNCDGKKDETCQCQYDPHRGDQQLFCASSWLLDELLELSQPTVMSDADKVSGWATRFILPPLRFGPEWDDRARDEAPHVDFDITPKQL